MAPTEDVVSTPPILIILVQIVVVWIAVVVLVVVVVVTIAPHLLSLFCNVGQDESPSMQRIT